MNPVRFKQIATIRPGVAQTIGIPGVKALITDPVQVRLPESALGVSILMEASVTDDCPNPDHGCTPTPPKPPSVPDPAPHAQTACLVASGTTTCNPDPMINHISSDEAAAMLAREIWASEGVATSMAGCDWTCKELIKLAYANPSIIDSAVNETVLDPISGIWFDPISLVNSKVPGVLPPLEPTYPSPWAGTHYVDAAAGMAYPIGHPTPMLYDSVIGPMCEFARSCHQDAAQEAFANFQPEPVPVEESGGFSAQGGGGGDDLTQPQCNDYRVTCQERCVNENGKAVYQSNACKQSIKLILGNYGGLTWQQDNRKQTFFTWVVHGRGMRNLDYDTLGMGWSPNPQDGQWKSDSPYRGGQWRRAQEEPVVENDLCFAKWTNETTWSYGSGSTERTPGVERDHYGRKIWQGNEYLARCPDVPSNIMVKRRLVAAYLFMSLYEDNDHSTSLENRKSAQPAAGFVHRFKTYGVEWQFPCPYGAIVTRSGKAIPFPCPTLASKNNSWAMVIDPGRKYYW